VQSEVALDRRWDSDNKDASRNDQRQKNLSIVNGHLSFGRCKPLACAVLIEALRIRASSRFSVTMLQTDPNGNDKRQLKNDI